MADWIGKYAREVQALLDKNKEAQVNEFLEQIVQQARAEVLAAGVAKLGDLMVSRQGVATKASKDGKEGLAQIFVDERDGIKSALRALKELQPAASDLEALLRQEREKFAVLQMHIYELLGDLHEMNAPDIADSMGRVETDLKNLEKARASEVKG